MRNSASRRRSALQALPSCEPAPCVPAFKTPPVVRRHPRRRPRGRAVLHNLRPLHFLCPAPRADAVARRFVVRHRRGPCDRRCPAKFVRRRAHRPSIATSRRSRLSRSEGHPIEPLSDVAHRRRKPAIDRPAGGFPSRSAETPSNQHSQLPCNLLSHDDRGRQARMRRKKSGHRCLGSSALCLSPRR